MVTKIIRLLTLLKSKKMKINSLIAIIILLISTNYVQAQNITYTFANAENTNDGANDYYEIDVLLESDSDFKLGTGQVYFSYNTAAFGTNISANTNVTYSYDYASNYLLGEFSGFTNYYTFSENDNTTSQASFAWIQGVSEGAITNSITSTASKLFHIKIKYVDINELPNVCFLSAAPFDDVTFTACGPSSASLADCGTYPGVQITTDNFDCTAAVLPVELLYFTGEAQEEDVLLSWETASEINNSHFEVERSTNGIEFAQIGTVEGSGTTIEQQYYEFLDESPVIGKNYYRLKQMDFDGNFEYTNIVVVEFDKEGSLITSTQISLFPNPTINIINLKTENLTIEGFQIYNAIGQLVMEKHSLNSGNVHQIDVDDLPSGTYYIQINGSTERLKFMKG